MASCKRPDALTTISKVDCPVDFGQFVALLFQRAQPSPTFASEAALKALASWTPLLTATDGTKVIKTPLFAGFVVPGSEPQYADENSNASIDGAGYFTGFNAVKATGTFSGIPSAVKSQLALVQDESAAGLDPGMTFFGVLGDGRIVYDLDTSGSSSVIRGIPFSNFYVGSLQLDGYKAKNKNAFGLSLPGDWDKNIQVVQPGFNPRTAL